MQSKKYVSLFLFISFVLLIEWLGHIFTFHSVGSWYLALDKPSWTPPSWLFGPVWTVLYICIAISGWLIFLKAKSFANCKGPFLIYGAQLFCNLIWSYFFFYLKSPLLALVDIALLVLMVLANTISFFRIYKPAGYLLAPYFLWVVYATVLNAAIWALNR